MRFYISFFILFLGILSSYAQNSIEEALLKYNNHHVAYINVHEAQSLDNYVFLDARKKEEYDVSHIADAKWVGTGKLDTKEMLALVPDTNSHIIVYCSIGVRSENTAEQFLEAGYTNIHNLYGGIFEWKNKNYPVFDNQGQKTNKVHAFSKHWGKFLTKGEKVY
ncbi:rhodanese-like domain-containing protein [Sediminicola sp. 1XM1-17]|uniref:rhodanese-like domain-containing protein n=1 Tax=Sediminicola sp. 1XM1-17 TaxID=3127702 RepID=UPI003076A011